jgi:hypothetical protein
VALAMAASTRGKGAAARSVGARSKASR